MYVNKILLEQNLLFESIIVLVKNIWIIKRLTISEVRELAKIVII